NVVLMRDLTDVMYDPNMSPNVSHFTGTSLMLEYIETHVSPTMVSTDFTGEKQFRFQEDDRPLVAFITAESEYRANQRLPEFAHELLSHEDINCEFALGKPIMKGEGRHNIENLQILKDADLAVVFIRRRALEQEKMELIREYVRSGKPLLGIRTASHAFDARKSIPREGGAIVLSDGSVSEMLAQWPEFDKDVLGGNYQGHFGHLKEGTKVAIIPGMEGHPLLDGFPLEGYTSPNWLYRNRPLLNSNAQVLLTGEIPGELPEPVFWINNNGSNKVIYTSLGHWDDWKEEGFRNVMLNSVRYLLGKEITKTFNYETTDFYK
ncbi:MAG: ThuA domain-containing protein, partial [Bacteroidales bacterium]|nr:ThuA domain-containing protein [Bacteroidales bacterium]